jgi:hypothetical protein
MVSWTRDDHREIFWLHRSINYAWNVMFLFVFEGTGCRFAQASLPFVWRVTRPSFICHCCEGLKSGFELESSLTFTGAGVSSSMKRYVLNLHLYCCSVYVLYKHSVVMGGYLALGIQTNVCSTQGFMSTFMELLFVKASKSDLLKSKLFYLIIPSRISFYETKILSTINVCRNIRSSSSVAIRV